MPIIGILPSDYIPPIFIEYVVVAGGGGGAFGGGGAGGMLTSASNPVETLIGQIHSIVIGAGGPRGINGSNSQLVINQTIAITAFGGGGGGNDSNGNSGGSGGGAGGIGYASGSGTAGQGYSGGPGNGYAGGGGAGGPGIITDPYMSSPQGGVGARNSVTGINTRLAGGGAGYDDLYTLGGDYGGGAMLGASFYNKATPGIINTGGGGGAGSFIPGEDDPSTVNNGGSGVVYIKYPKEYSVSASIGLTLNTYTLGSEHKVTRFTAGAGTFQFTVV